MNEFKIHKINWNLVKKINHDHFGDGIITNFFTVNFVGAQIPFIRVEYKDYDCLYIVGNWEEFYKTYNSIEVDLHIGRKVKHFQFGDGIIEKMENNENKVYVTIKFNDGEKKFNAVDLTSEFFDINILPLFDNTFKEACYFSDSLQLNLLDARGAVKSVISTWEPDIFLYRVVRGAGYRNYNSITYEIIGEKVKMIIDKNKNKQINYYYDPYSVPQFTINNCNSRLPFICGSTDVIWNNQQRYKEDRSRASKQFVYSEDEELNNEIFSDVKDYSRSNDTGWFYSDEE